MTDADREAAAKLISDYWHGDYSPAGQGMKRMAESYRNGHTQGVWVQAFARHREASIAPYVEALAEIHLFANACLDCNQMINPRALLDIFEQRGLTQIDALLENGHD